MVPSKIYILLLCDDPHGTANTVSDHINAFLQLSRYKVYKYNPRNLPFNFLLDLNEFDAVVIHYSLATVSDHYVSPDLRRKIHDFKGPKIQYIQDDYRQVDQYTAVMRCFGIHVLFTPYPQEKIPLIYDEQRLPGVIKRTTLTGYVPERHRKIEAPPLEKRAIDVGYRGRPLPYWLGILSQEKNWIAEDFPKYAALYGLKCDISSKENDRIYGKQWDRYVSSCKAMLGTESGASITDFDSLAEIKTKEYLAIHPQADFWEVHENVLKPYEGNLVENTISPRVFECAAHRTAMILFPGEYSKILQPWVHYIPLQKDFSNFDEVAARVRDVDFLNALTERAYRDLIASEKYSYRTMIKEFDEVLESLLNTGSRVPRPKIRFGLVPIEMSLAYLRVHIIKPVHRFIKSVRKFMLNPKKNLLKITRKYVRHDEG